jgi:RNA polymerase sigma-70 factor, ECF subfamily
VRTKYPAHSLNGGRGRWRLCAINASIKGDSQLDHQTLTSLRNGDRDAFSCLVRDHHRSLQALARTIVPSADAEEIVQNAWIKAYGAIAAFEGRSNIRTWLSRIVINEAKMTLRRKGRELTLAEDPGHDALEDRFDGEGTWNHPPATWSADSPESLLMQQDMADCLERTLAEMPPNQRALVELRDVQQLPFDEICNRLGISASNARVLLHRGRAQIFALVDHYQETGEC